LIYNFCKSPRLLVRRGDFFVQDDCSILGEVVF